jgi:hypothetical protein
MYHIDSHIGDPFILDDPYYSIIYREKCFVIYVVMNLSIIGCIGPLLCMLIIGINYELKS